MNEVAKQTPWRSVRPQQQRQQQQWQQRRQRQRPSAETRCDTSASTRSTRAHRHIGTSYARSRSRVHSVALVTFAAHACRSSRGRLLSLEATWAVCALFARIVADSLALLGSALLGSPHSARCVVRLQILCLLKLQIKVEVVVRMKECRHVLLLLLLRCCCCCCCHFCAQPLSLLLRRCSAANVAADV